MCMHACVRERKIAQPDNSSVFQCAYVPARNYHYDGCWLLGLAFTLAAPEFYDSNSRNNGGRCSMSAAVTKLRLNGGTGEEHRRGCNERVPSGSGTGSIRRENRQTRTSVRHQPIVRDRMTLGTLDPHHECFTILDVALKIFSPY